MSSARSLGRGVAGTRAGACARLSALGLLLAGVLTLAACGGLADVWGTVGPSSGEVIIALAADPHDVTLLYAGGASGHIFRVSTGEPATISAGQGVPAADATNVLLPDPTTRGRILAATTDGLLLSTDSGAHWARYGSGLPPKDSVESLTFGASTSTLYAGTEAHAVYVSQDGGSTWQASGNGLPTNADIYTLYWQTSTRALFAGLVGAGVYVSRDGAQSWQSIGQGIPARSDIFQFGELGAQGGQASPTLLAGTSSGLYRSEDGGRTWQAPPAKSGLPAGRVLSLATQPGAATTVFAGTDSTVYRSTDGGLHWSLYASGLSAHVAALVVVAQRGAAPTVFAAAGSVERMPSPIAGPSPAALFIAAIMIVVLFWVFRRRQRAYRRLYRRQEEESAQRGRSDATPDTTP